MEIELYRSGDFEIEENSDILGCGYSANGSDNLLALGLYDFLTSEEGVCLINRLRTEHRLITLCQVDRPSHVRVVLSGEGLMMHLFRSETDFDELPVSCLAVCCFWNDHRRRR